MLSMIVAVDENFAIGNNNKLLWHLSDDLKNFKKLTTGHGIIMGRKTFDSIGKLLPHRENIILTRDSNFFVEGAIIINELEKIYSYLDDEKQYFVIGGGEIYNLFINQIERIYITEVKTKVKQADTFIEKLDFSLWNLIEKKEFKKNEKNDFDFSFSIWSQFK